MRSTLILVVSTMLIATAARADAIDGDWCLADGRQMTLLARVRQPIADGSWSVDEIGLEELLLAYMGPGAHPEPPPPRPRLLQWHG